MAEVKVVVKNEVQGKREISDVAQQWNSLKSTLGNVTGALGLVAAGMAATWKIAEQGATLELSAQRFDRLSESIGATSDALLNDLSAATGSMMTNAQMMESASQIISLGLADNQQDVVDLASLVSQLGWDMNQVILTFANNSVMRLDALGLSVTDVKDRAAELEAQGYDTDKAFDLAVIQAGQAKLELLGSAAGTSAGAMSVLKVHLMESVDDFKIWVSEGIAPSVDAINTLYDVLGDGGDVINGIVDANIEQAQGVDDLVEQYKRLDAQLGLGSSFTGTSDDIRDNMEKVRMAIIDTTTSSDEYVAAMVEMGFMTQWQADRNRNAIGAEYLRIKAIREERKEQEELNRETAQADSILMQNASAYKYATAESKSFALTVAQVNYHQEEAYEGMVNSTRILEQNAAQTSATASAWQSATSVAGSFAETTNRVNAELDALTRQETQAFLAAVDGTTSTLNQTMQDYIVAADGSAEKTGLFMLATGELSKEQYLAAQNTLIMQESMKALAELYADGELSLSDLRTEMDKLVAGSPYLADAEIDTQEAKTRMDHLKNLLDGFDGRHVRATATVETNEVRGPTGKGGENKGGGTTPGGSVPPSGATPPQGPALAGGTDGWVTVPPGYPNDTYPVRLSSGERLNVVPNGGSMGGSMGGINVTVNVTTNGGNGRMIGRQVADVVAEQLGKLS